MSDAKEIASIEKSEESPVNPSKEGGYGSAEPRGTPAVRRRLPDERHSLTHHFSEGWLSDWAMHPLVSSAAR